MLTTPRCTCCPGIRVSGKPRGVAALNHHDGCRWQSRSQPDVHQVHLATHVRAQDNPWLEGPESDGVVRAPHLTWNLAGVRLQSTGQIHSDGEFGVDRVPDRDRVRPQRPASADSHHRVEHHVAPRA